MWWNLGPAGVAAYIVTSQIRSSLTSLKNNEQTNVFFCFFYSGSLVIMLNELKGRPINTTMNLLTTNLDLSWILKKVLYVSQMSLSAPSVDIRVSPSVTEINRDSTAKSVLYKPAQEA